MKEQPAQKRLGRPPAGQEGQRVADYPQLTARLPPATFAKLKAWAKVTGRPAWRLVAEAIEAAVGRLTGSEARDVRSLTKRELDRLTTSDE
jgi:predicted DNA-binding protein